MAKIMIFHIPSNFTRLFSFFCSAIGVFIVFCRIFAENLCNGTGQTSDTRLPLSAHDCHMG